MQSWQGLAKALASPEVTNITLVLVFLHVFQSPSSPFVFMLHGAVSCHGSVFKICLFIYLLFHQEAIETFKEALKLKSDFIDAYKSLGQAYRCSLTVAFLFFL